MWSEDEFWNAKTITKTTGNDLLHVLVEFKTLMKIQLFFFCSQPLIYELFLKVVIAKGIQ